MTDDHMLREHQQTWHGFTRLLLWSVIAVVVTLVVLGIWLVD